MPLHRSHQHTQPLPPTRQQPDAHLPEGGFIGLVGTFDHATYVPYDGKAPDGCHIYLWVRVATGRYAGRYEAAVNVQNDCQDPGAPTSLMAATRDQPLEPVSWPAVGVATDAAVSYAALGLRDEEFSVVQEGALRSLMLNYASSCQLMVIYGNEYPERTGLHDVHLNAGAKGTDGALVFYFDSDHGGPIARWIFLKFQADRVG